MTMLTSVMTLADSLRVKRAAILHVGDVGMCHGANRGFLELAERGFVTCGSVMVPCPWFRQIAYGLLPVLPRKIRFAPELAGYDATVAGLDRAGLAVVDGIRGTLPVAAEAVEPGYRKLVDELPAGVTHFALHCAAPGDRRGDYAATRVVAHQRICSLCIRRRRQVVQHAGCRADWL